MSRKAIVTTIAIYVAVSLAFGAFTMLMEPDAASLRMAVLVGGTIGTAFSAFAIPGILPLVFWAFARFRAEKAAGPLVWWAILGVIIMILMEMGRRAG